VLAAASVGQTTITETMQKDGLALTPQKGWTSWNKFGCKIDENLMRAKADAFVASGMLDAGYRYLNIDDCWMAEERSAAGVLQADPERFPSGIKALADPAHARGLKLGIYPSAGTKTSERLPAGRKYAASELWANTEKPMSGSLSATVPAHNAAMFIVGQSGK